MTKIKQSQSSGRRYGLLSMLSLIVGVVIGSGIFFKNDQLWASTGGSVTEAGWTSGSTLEIMIAWIFVAILIIFMLIAFLEITSITTRKKEQGTVANWSRHLWGEETSKFIGFFFALVYFPVLLAGLTVFTSNYLIQGIETTTGTLTIFNLHTQWSNFIISFLLGLIILIGLYSMNSFTNKPGKIVQIGGTFIKLIPLAIVVIVGFFAISGIVSSDYGQTVGDIFDPNSDINGGWDGGILSLKTILMILPAVMFSFDGFLFAASLSNDAKKPSTYKIAAISGVSFITVIYLLITLSIFLIGNPEIEGGMTVSGSLAGIFPNQGWIETVMLYLIFISMATGVSGNIISTQRMVSGLSYDRYIVDKRGLLIKRNKSGVPEISGLLAMGITLIWYIINRSMDAFVLLNAVSLDSTFNAQISGWATDFVIIGSFSIYGLILIGGMKNRITKEVYTEKTKLFIPAVLIVVPSIAIILVYFIGSIFAFDFSNSETKAASIMKITFLFLFIGSWLVITLGNKSRVKKVVFTTQEEKRRKIYNYAYVNMLTQEEALTEVYKKKKQPKKRKKQTTKKSLTNKSTKNKKRKINK